MTTELGVARSSQLISLLHHLMLPLLLLLLLHSTASGATERMVHWNSSNPIFKPVGENLITVQLQDRVIFVCPHDGVEYYQIYWTTSWAQSQACSGGSLLFSCRRMDSYLVYVQIFPADPTAPGFNNPVYFYTPSSGDLIGMDQTQGGACLSRNMRLTVRVGDSAASASTSPTDVAASATEGPPPPPSDGHPGGPELPSPALRHQTTSNSNNGMLSSRRPLIDEDNRRDPYQLNLITGCSMTSPHPMAVVALSCAVLLTALLPRVL